MSVKGIVLLALAAIGCKQAPQRGAPPPPEVAVVQVAPRTVDQVYEFSGNVEASKSVSVRPQVGGVIVERPFVEGRAVRKGEVLYRIDPTAYDADWRAAKGHLADAEARHANAEQSLARFRALVTDNAISKQDYDNAVAEEKQARAGVEEAKGLLDRAKKNLDDTEVRAELPGRVGRAMIERGQRVKGSDDVLTTIDVLDPIYVSFWPSAQQQLAWRRDPESAKALAVGGSVKVQVVLPDGSTYARLGRIGFIDPVVDQATGTQRYRAEFPNPDRLLLPGQFARVKLLGLRRENAILVPQRAVLEAMGRQTVYVVSPGDTVKVRDVTATSWSGGDWVIEQGLAAGDRVIVDGVQKIGPGLKVHPVPAADSTTAAAGGAAAGAGKPPADPAKPGGPSK
jgi:membrane fusion protein (multidrug efflux system)